MQSIDRFLTVPAVITDIVKSSEPDEWGEQTETTTAHSTTCWLDQQRHSREGGAGAAVTLQEVEHDMWRSFWRADELISSTSRVVLTIAGEEQDYEVAGVPWEVVDFRQPGRVHHIEANLQHTA